MHFLYILDGGFCNICRRFPNRYNRILKLNNNSSKNFRAQSFILYTILSATTWTWSGAAHATDDAHNQDLIEGLAFRERVKDDKLNFDDKQLLNVCLPKMDDPDLNF
jgi:hypothetical protein